MAGLANFYAGRVSHIRHTPFKHKFDYRIWMMAIDLDALDARQTEWFKHNRFSIISIYDKDHGFRDGRPLRDFVAEALGAQQLERFGHRIVFVTIPRFLGYAFNPISFYYCYDEAGVLGAVLHQVKNTFGDQIGYLMPVLGPGMIRQSAPKKMFVSPFFDMQGGYRFALTGPEDRLNVTIVYGTPEEKRMTAAMSLKEMPFGLSSLLRLSVQMPFTPMKVIIAIHWQALKLWIRGAAFRLPGPARHKTIIAGETH